MAVRLEVTTEEFYREYARKLNGRWSLQEKHTLYGNDCVLLDRESSPGRALCSAYGDRPKQCRTWPFWWINLRSRKDWIAVKKSTPCPGMDKGDLVALDCIQENLDT